MRIQTTLIALSLCALVASCTKESAASTNEATAEATPENAGDKAAKEGDDCANCEDGMMTPGTALDAEALTKGITLEEFTLISEILAAPDGFEGKRVLVKGEAVGVCAKRGCWVTLKSEADNTKALRVKVKDGEIVFPMTVKGHEVVVEGVLEKMVTAEEDYREILKKRAEAKGETFDPKSVTGPRITWQLKGLGAKWES